MIYQCIHVDRSPRWASARARRRVQRRGGAARREARLAREWLEVAPYRRWSIIHEILLQNSREVFDKLIYNNYVKKITYLLYYDTKAVVAFVSKSSSMPFDSQATQSHTGPELRPTTSGLTKEKAAFVNCKFDR